MAKKQPRLAAGLAPRSEKARRGQGAKAQRTKGLPPGDGARTTAGRASRPPESGPPLESETPDTTGHLKKGVREMFLEVFRQTCNVSLAAKAAGVRRQTHYEWLGDADYRAAFEQAREDAVERLEAEAWRRAVEGVPKGIYHQGALVATEQEFSDTLLIFLMKAHRPQFYRERGSVEVSGPLGQPIGLAAFPMTLDVKTLDDDTLRRLFAEYSRRLGLPGPDVVPGGGRGGASPPGGPPPAVGVHPLHDA